ncbi:MAG: outer membrane beta-barrel protein, partial [Cyclobacteriaceae bacterium]
MNKSIIPWAFLLCLVTLSANAQKIQFHVNAGVNQYADDSQTDIQKFFNIRNTIINDTTQVLQFGETRIERDYAFSPRLGYELGVSSDIQLSKRFKVSIGLGVQYYEINFSSTLISFDFESYVSDTTFFSPVAFPPNQFSGCSFTTNTPQDLREPDSGLGVTQVDLAIPFGIEYAVIPDKLDINIGGILQTPVFSDATFEFVDLHREYSPGQIVCEYFINERVYQPLSEL